MSVQNPHHFSPLWLYTNQKQINTQKTGRSGFATLNGVSGHLPLKKTYTEEVPHAIITNINNASFKNKTSEFPSLQSTKSGKASAVDNGAWSLPRSKGKLYNAVKGGSKPSANPPKSKTQATEADKVSSPKVKVPKSQDTSSKFNFFKSLRLDEGLIVSDNESVASEGEDGADSTQSVPLSSSVETEHRLLKEMGWSDTVEPPLTEEELLAARRDLENKKKNTSPPVLSPFPWAPKIYIPSEGEEESLTSDESEDDDDL